MSSAVMDLISDIMCSKHALEVSEDNVTELHDYKNDNFRATICCHANLYYMFTQNGCHSMFCSRALYFFLSFSSNVLTKECLEKNKQ